MARLLVTLLALGCVVAAVSGYAYPASYHPYNPYNANYEYNPYFPYANAPVRGHYSYGSTNMNCHPLYGCGKDVAIESTQMANCKINGQVDRSAELMQNLSSLLQTSEFANVTFIVNDKRFNAHKELLAMQSDYFRSMLFGEFREGREREIEVKETTPEAFGQMLTFLYTGKLSLQDKSIDKVIDLVKLSDLCQIQLLKSDIATYLQSTVSAENMCTILENAKLYSLPGLANTCYAFFDKNVLDVISKEKFNNVSSDLVEELLKRQRNIPQFAVFNAVSREKKTFKEC
uniref:BTB domain-containing protein n=1 Tax=Steinernema glaseri TaxID=37863 RepID=A0A1I8AU78_9BILA